MVQGIAALNRKLTVTIPKRVEDATRRAMEKGAEELVAMMQRLAPFEDIRESIRWKWGNAPKGTFTLDKMETSDRGGLKITVYATDYRARWFEFGTAERFQKTTGRRTGRIQQHPFFFPSYRALRKRIKSRVTREMKKAIQGMGQ
jgi:hypothetical protein